MISAVLVFTVVTPVQAASQSTGDEVFEPGIVPLVESPAVEVPPTTIPQGDFSDLAAEAAASGGEGVAPGGEGVPPGSGSSFEAPQVSSAPGGRVSDVADLSGAEVLERSEFETVYENPAGGIRV